MSDLIHIVYLSVSARKLAEKEQNELLTEIRRNNKILEVTGLLLYNDEFFTQVIEGAKNTIQNLHETIKKDSRHGNFVKLLEEPIENRAFPDWSMGYRKINTNEDSSLPGFSNFMNADQPTENMEGITEEVMHLLNSFRTHT